MLWSLSRLGRPIEVLFLLVYFLSWLLGSHSDEATLVSGRSIGSCFLG